MNIVDPNQPNQLSTPSRDNDLDYDDDDDDQIPQLTSNVNHLSMPHGHNIKQNKSNLNMGNISSSGSSDLPDSDNPQNSNNPHNNNKDLQDMFEMQQALSTLVHIETRKTGLSINSYHGHARSVGNIFDNPNNNNNSNLQTIEPVLNHRHSVQNVHGLRAHQQPKLRTIPSTPIPPSNHTISIRHKIHNQPKLQQTNSLPLHHQQTDKPQLQQIQQIQSIQPQLHQIQSVQPQLQQIQSIQPQIQQQQIQQQQQQIQQQQQQIQQMQQQQHRQSISSTQMIHQPISPTHCNNQITQQNIHPALQELYNQQQQLLNQLQLLEKNDPDPHSAKLWSVMQKIFTEENAQQRKNNISELTSTLKKKFEEVKNNDNPSLPISEQRIIRLNYEITKETHKELKEMRKQLDRERKLNLELRDKVKRKNRQLKALSDNKKNMINNDNDNDDIKSNVINIAPMAYGDNIYNNNNNNNNNNYKTRRIKSSSIGTDFSITENKPSTFQNWCVNMGFQTKNTKCSWF